MVYVPVIFQTSYPMATWLTWNFFFLIQGKKVKVPTFLVPATQKVLFKILKKIQCDDRVDMFIIWKCCEIPAGVVGRI
jgi:hypothetical protein